MVTVVTPGLTRSLTERFPKCRVDQEFTYRKVRIGNLNTER